LRLTVRVAISMAVTVAVALVICTVLTDPGAVVTLDDFVDWADASGAAITRAATTERQIGFMDHLVYVMDALQSDADAACPSAPGKLSVQRDRRTWDFGPRPRRLPASA
jgi:hypothetical protein